MTGEQLTHLDERGQAAMVDVSAKAVTVRTAVAQGEVHMQPATLAAIRDGAAPKGDVLAAARIAGIMAAKRTPELIPLCHTLLLSKVAVEFEIDETATAWSSPPRCAARARRASRWKRSPPSAWRR